MSNETPTKPAAPAGIQPLPKYTGPEIVYAIDPELPWDESMENGRHDIHTSIVLDDPEYRDAIRVRVDGIEGALFYLDRHGAKALIAMLSRDLEKLRLCIQIDPAGVR